MAELTVQWRRTVMDVGKFRTQNLIHLGKISSVWVECWVSREIREEFKGEPAFELSLEKDSGLYRWEGVEGGWHPGGGRVSAQSRWCDRQTVAESLGCRRPRGRGGAGVGWWGRADGWGTCRLGSERRAVLNVMATRGFVAGVCHDPISDSECHFSQQVWDGLDELQTGGQEASQRAVIQERSLGIWMEEKGFEIGVWWGWGGGTPFFFLNASRCPDTLLISLI